MPTINITEIYEQVKPWDLSLEIDSKVCNVRRLNAIDIAKIQRAAKVSDDEARATIAALFEEPAPDVNVWDAEKIALVVTAITGWYSEMIVKKKLEDVQTAISLAMPRRR